MCSSAIFYMSYAPKEVWMLFSFWCPAVC
jgi:hypothetical protein